MGWINNTVAAVWRLHPANWSLRSEKVDPVHPKDPGLAALFDLGTLTEAGKRMTPERALQIPAYYMGVSRLAGLIASLPLKLYRRLPDGGREPDTAHPLYPILHDLPNEEHTSLEFREILLGHLLIYNRAHARIIGNRRQPVQELIPMLPSETEVVRRPSGAIVFDHQPTGGMPRRVLLREEVFYLRGFSFDGLKGVETWRNSRETLGLAAVLEEYVSRYFANDASPGGYLKHPARLSKEASDRLKQQWEERHMGPKNARRVSVLEEGMDWQDAGQGSNRQAELTNLRKFQLTELARLLNVPPHFVNDLDRATFNNIEEMGRGLLTLTGNPIMVRYEQAIARDLMTPKTRDTHFAEFERGALVQADLATKFDTYATALLNGIMTINEVRAMENLAPVEGGDVNRVQQQMFPIDAESEEPAPEPPPEPAPAPDPESEEGADTDA